MGSGDVVLLSGLVSFMTVIVVLAVRDVMERYIFGPVRAVEARAAAATERVAEVQARVAKLPPGRIAMAASVGMCSNPTCARPTPPAKAREGYLCASCAGIDAPPYLPRS